MLDTDNRENALLLTVTLNVGLPPCYERLDCDVNQYPAVADCRMAELFLSPLVLRQL